MLGDRQHSAMGGPDRIRKVVNRVDGGLGAENREHDDQCRDAQTLATAPERPGSSHGQGDSEPWEDPGSRHWNECGRIVGGAVGSGWRNVGGGRLSALLLSGRGQRDRGTAAWPGAGMGIDRVSAEEERAQEEAACRRLEPTPHGVQRSELPPGCQRCALDRCPFPSIWPAMCAWN
jgi:hypothetical protein